jgi:hypothetical protein
VKLMRIGLIIVIVLALMLPPACPQAPTPLIPQLTVVLNDTSVNVTKTLESEVNISINGYVQMDKLPGERIQISLNASVSLGWDAIVEPAMIVTTDTQQHVFKATVVVPKNADGQASLTVSGSAQGGGFVSTNSATAIITVKRKDQPVTNTTTGSGTNSTSAGHNATAPSIDYTLPVVGAVAAVGITGAGYFAYARRRRQQ